MFTKNQFNKIPKFPPSANKNFKMPVDAVWGS